MLRLFFTLLGYKLTEQGVSLVEVHPAYTSQTFFSRNADTPVSMATRLPECRTFLPEAIEEIARGFSLVYKEGEELIMSIINMFGS